MVRRALFTIGFVFTLAFVGLHCGKSGSSSAGNSDGSISQDSLNGTGDSAADRDAIETSDSDPIPSDGVDQSSGNEDGTTSSEDGSTNVDSIAPGEFLSPCQSNKDCISGYCVPFKGSFVCSKKCITECPEGWNCRTVENTFPDVVLICFPEKPCATDCPYGCNEAEGICYDELKADAGNPQTTAPTVDVTLTGTATGGDGNYSCEWKDGNGNVVAKPDCTTKVTPGTTTTYVLTVTDGQGHFSVDTVTVTVTADLVANAGADQRVISGSSVDLTGGHTGGVGQVSCQWYLGAQLVSSDCAYTTPALTQTTTFELVVTDATNTTASDDVTLTVSDFIANAGPDKNVLSGETTTLNGSYSGGYGSVTCRWLDDAGTELHQGCDFTTPPLGASATLTLEVTDEDGNKATDTVALVIFGDLLVSAGPDKDLISGQSTMLNGSASGGVGTSTSFSCRWLLGGTVLSSTCGNYDTGALTKAGSSTPQVLTFTYEVTDEGGNVRSDTVDVRVFDPLVADAGPDKGVISGQTTSLDGSGSSGGTSSLTCRWLIGSSEVSTSCSFTTSVIGANTTFTLEVKDKDGNSATDTVTITVYPVLTADAGEDQKVLKGSNVSVVGSSTGGVPPTFSCDWFFGSNATAEASDTCTPTFTNLQSTVTIKLRVYDQTDKPKGERNTAEDTLTITVTSILAKAGDDQQIFRGDPVTVTGDADGPSAYSCKWEDVTDPNNPVTVHDDVAPNCAFTATPLFDRIYRLTVTDPATNDSDSDEMQVFVREKLRAQAGPDRKVKQGGSLTIDGGWVGGIAPVTCEWFEGPDDSGTKVASSCSLSLSNIQSDGTYTLKVTDSSNPQQSDLDSVAIGIVKVVADAGPDQLIDAGTEAKLGGSCVGCGATVRCDWQWTKDDGSTGTLQDNCNLSDFPSYHTTYTLTVTDVTSGETDTDSVTVYVKSGGVNLCRWFTLNFDIRPGLDNGPGAWVPDTASCVPDGNGVLISQTNNADPTGQISDIVLQNVRITGSIRVTGNNDDDYIGFLWGYQDPQHFHLFTWKRAAQNSPGENGVDCGRGLRGTALLKFDGSGTTQLTDYECFDFWNTERPHDHATTVPGSKSIAQLILSPGDPLAYTQGWNFNTLYRFYLIYKPGYSRIQIFDETTSVLLFDYTYNDSSYPSGRFGWYLHSQPNVEFGYVALDSCAANKADAGLDATIANGATHTLRGGTVCRDQIVTCRWYDEANPTVVIANTCTATVSPPNNATTTYRLEVDLGASTLTDTVTITTQ